MPLPDTERSKHERIWRYGICAVKELHKQSTSVNNKAREAHEKVIADGGTPPALSLPVSQAELDGIQRAWDACTDLAEYLNEMKRDIETKQLIVAIEQRSPALTPFLSLIPPLVLLLCHHLRLCFSSLIGLLH